MGGGARGTCVVANLMVGQTVERGWGSLTWNKENEKGKRRQRSQQQQSQQQLNTIGVPHARVSIETKD